MKKVAVIHHNPPFHIDDFLAVSMLIYKYSKNGYKVYTITVPSITREEILSMAKKYNKIIVVDVGMNYGREEVRNTEIVYLDHHHDKSLPSSFHLALKEEFPELYSIVDKSEALSALLDLIDAADTGGPRKVEQMFGVSKDSRFFKASWLLPRLMITDPNYQVGHNIYDYIMEYKIVYDNAKIVEYHGVRAAILYSSKYKPSVVFDVTKADLLVMRNTRNPEHTSIIKNSDSKMYDKLDLSKLKEKYDVVFYHTSGFIIVLNHDIYEVDDEIEEVIRIAKKE